MIKLKSLLSKSILEACEGEKWWTDMSSSEQKKHLQLHPGSKCTVIKDNPSGKKERGEGDWKQGKDGWEILDDERAKVTKTRDYTEEEYQEETGEYFGNSDVIAPNLANSDEELVDKMKNAPTEYLSSEEMENMNNSNVGELLNASEEGGSEAMKNLGKKRAKEYDKNWDRLEKGIEDLDKEDSDGVPPPMALRDKKGDLHLLAGNTRMMSFTASGKKLPVKVIDYDGEFDYDAWEEKQKKDEEEAKKKSQKVEEGELNEYSKFRLNIPSDIRNIHKLFKKNKKKLFVVGGAVRDAILGKNPKDFDLATDAKPDEVLAIAKKGGLKTYEVGKQFGVVIVAGHEIATFRKDVGKGRRPSSVDYTDIEGDVKRRDLTINALFYDLDRGEIVDLVGGIADLKKKKIRTVGKPVERFDEDPLRKMRALRFQGALGGKLGKETEKALRQNPSLKGVSKERIRDEFVKSIRKAKSTKKYLQLADSLGFTKQILPGFQVKVPYINENDYVLFLAWILRKNDVNSIRKLNGLAYPNQEIVDIQFLNSLQNFKPENIFLIKKFQEKTKLSKGQILKWGKYIGKDFKKLVRFKLSVKGRDVSKDLKGKEIGKAIQNMEKDKFLNENRDKAKLYKLYSKAMKMMPGSSAQKKVKKEIDKLRKKLKMNEIAVRKKPKKFKDIYNALPSDLKKRVYNLKNYDQRRDAHPEGNVLKHTIAVTNRALKTGDIDFALSALFHDIGKDKTAKLHPKKGFWTHYGHEHVSAKLVKKYRKWIISMGGNPLDIYWIVKQHMRMKVFDKMKWTKQDKMKKFRAFDKLKKFTTFDKGGRR